MVAFLIGFIVGAIFAGYKEEIEGGVVKLFNCIKNKFKKNKQA